MATCEICGGDGATGRKVYDPKGKVYQGMYCIPCSLKIMKGTVPGKESGK